MQFITKVIDKTSDVSFCKQLALCLSWFRSQGKGTNTVPGYMQLGRLRKTLMKEQGSQEWFPKFPLFR